MSEKQPEALRLAFIFDDAAEMMEATPDDYFRQTAAELRRQHALLEEMAGALNGVIEWERAQSRRVPYRVLIPIHDVLAKREASK